MHSILRIISDLSALRAAWEREPFVSAGLGDFSDVFSAESAERLIASGVSLALVRMSLRGAALPAQRFSRPYDPNPRSKERLADVGKVTALLSEGATLVLEEVQSYSVPVASFAAAIARETGYQTDCTAFLTPPWSRGFDAHFDAASVLLRQVSGSKRWRIGAPPQRWPRRRCRPDDDIDTEQVLDVVLKAGQSLYIPGGFVHVGETADESSVHLSISLRTVSWGEALQSVLATAAAKREELREALPPTFSELDPEEVCRERLAVLSEELSKIQWSDIAAGTAPRGVFPPAAAAYVPPAPGALVAALDGGGSRPGRGDDADSRDDWSQQ